MGAGEFATDYDGASDRLSRGSDLTGNANSKLGIFSCWARLDGGNGSTLRIIHAVGSRFAVLRTTANIFQIIARNGGLTLDIETTNTFEASSSFVHLLASWDMGNNKKFLYMDDSSDLSVNTFNDNTIDYTRDAWGIASASSEANLFNGALSEFYLNTAEFLDLSVTANRRKFIGADGKPVPLGADGSGPTGTAAIIYAPDGNAVVNQGTGGNFTKNGAPVRIAGPGDKPSPAAKIYEVLRGS